MLRPPAVPLPEDPRPRVLAAGQALAEAFRAHGADFLDALRAALEGKVLNGQSYKLDWIEALWSAWSAWCEAGAFDAPLDAKIERLTADALRAKANKGKEAKVPDSPVCAAIAAYVDAVQARRDYLAHRRAALLHRLRDDARDRMALLKRQRRVQGYDDLIRGGRSELSRTDEMNAVAYERLQALDSGTVIPSDMDYDLEELLDQAGADVDADSDDDLDDIDDLFGRFA